MLYSMLLALLLPINLILLSEAVTRCDPVSRRLLLTAFACLWIAASLMFWDTVSY